MFKAKKITIFLPEDGKTQVFENVEFQSSPEVNLISIFPGKGKESIISVSYTHLTLPTKA